VWHEGDNYLCGPTATDFTAINGALIYVGAISLVCGSVPAAPETSAHYAIDAVRCARYVERVTFYSSDFKIWNAGVNVAYKRVPIPGQMRTIPACSWLAGGTDFEGWQCAEWSVVGTITAATPVIIPESGAALLLAISGTFPGGGYALHSSYGSIVVLDSDLYGYA
jgi:hypothetical protein